jgi:tRNA A-37 threonylcarbamoyl transferase component Bud32
VTPGPEDDRRIEAPRGWTLGARLQAGASALIFEVARPSTPRAVLKWARRRDPAIDARFAREASALDALGPPASPRCLEHGVVDGRPYTIIEHVPGEALSAWLVRRGGHGGSGEILAILTMLAGALAAIHERGFVHGDVQPEHVVIGPRGVRLIGFGLARPAEHPPAGGGEPRYVAPELVVGADLGVPADHRADLYSFGALAFEMLAGRPPFLGADANELHAQHVSASPGSLRERREVPGGLEAVVLACLAKQPASRPRSAGEVRVAIASAYPEPAGEPRPRSVGAPAPVAFLWIEGGDQLDAIRVLAERRAIVARRRGLALIAVFTGADHVSPVAAAVNAARVVGATRMVIHAGTAVVRRSDAGRIAVYGDDVEHAERWTTGGPTTGTALTPAARESAGACSGMQWCMPP